MPPVPPSLPPPSAKKITASHKLACLHALHTHASRGIRIIKGEHYSRVLDGALNMLGRSAETAQSFFHFPSHLILSRRRRFLPHGINLLLDVRASVPRPRVPTNANANSNVANRHVRTRTSESNCETQGQQISRVAHPPSVRPSIRPSVHPSHLRFRPSFPLAASGRVLWSGKYYEVGRPRFSFLFPSRRLN